MISVFIQLLYILSPSLFWLNVVILWFMNSLSCPDLQHQFLIKRKNIVLRW